MKDQDLAMAHLLPKEDIRGDRHIALNNDRVYGSKNRQRVVEISGKRSFSTEYQKQKQESSSTQTKRQEGGE